MANIKKTLESGAVIEIQVASFELSHKLLQAVKASSLPQEDALGLILHPQVQEALWPCLNVCTYNTARITPFTFEPETAREDYLQVAKEALVANLRPFLKSLGSKS